MTATTGVRELTATFRSMASDVTVRVVGPRPDAPEAVGAACAAIRSVAAHLTRFDAASALSHANARPSAWHLVPAELAEAVEEAERAHRITDGLFDPRVIDELLAWGYDRTFDDVTDATRPARRSPAAPRVPRPWWRPTVLPGSGRRLVHLGGSAIDLGGIGKGLAVRRAASALAGAGDSVLVDAGGDEWLAGPGPDGDGWRIGVENPLGGDDPVLVLCAVDSGCATSSVRRRRWVAPDGTPVHHLVDPRTGRPGGPGLSAVTVLHPDPAWAEVWSKTLFLAGAVEVEAQAEVRELAAAWVTDTGTVRVSHAMEPHVLWRAA